MTFVDGGGSTLTFSAAQLVLDPDGGYTLAAEARFNDTDVGDAITAETQFGGIPFEVDLEK